MKFRLGFPRTQIKRWAAQYSYPGEQDLLEHTVAHVRAAGFLTKIDLVQIGLWKSRRIKRHLNRNDDSTVRECTRFAMSAKSEAVRPGVLTLLPGVGWPVASAILHFCHRDRYPILDFRALWSVGVKVPPSYSLPFWLEYTDYCRQLARTARVEMRTLDRALWQFSKERQP